MQETLEQAIHTHYTMLLKLAYTYVKNREMAQDIVQDVCEKAVEKEESFRAEASYKTYLIRMTINRSYDYLRSWKYKQHVLMQSFHLDTPEQRALKRDTETQLGLAILKLKPIYREIIVLYYYEDFSIPEISAILTIPEGTVKTRLKRAREQLKKKLGGLIFDA
ncbi:sigma-70 family RNA polymerase sigma factor [Metasolibacillus meyeri]|uniref:Sigma-70 family RNA polymerase sigma factor n=1 Tax=Metasolibacillus meyeri TaxID=1071052 RepID=A0AAW9NYH4_9BACL|nr:sigma-70 family RNA polymerase sigma factor [Metasolibacillus meyeri]MEC1179813.1 sigma-70 family RNA polymerase sigma factor [Metasolibacillus meyeri]